MINSHVLLPEGVEDTKALRRELAKLSHRIAAKEHIYTAKEYIYNWPLKLYNKQLTPEQIRDLYDLYSNVMWDNEEWKLLDEYNIHHMKR